MIVRARRNPGQDTSPRDGGGALGAASARPPSDEPTLDQLFAEPIVQRLMRRDQTDEASIRRLLQATAAAQPASQAEDDPDTDDPHPIVWLLYETARLWRSRYDREV